MLGVNGCGKCFARGTRLRLVNGECIAVEDVVGGEQLMGDDGQPRTVGSLTQGVGPLYEITPKWDGARPFTVNGAHTLVLVNNTKPWMYERSDGGWRVAVYELTADNRMRKRAPTFRTKRKAKAALKAVMATWQPLEWEVSVEEYLAAPPEMHRLCMLVACDAITFTNPLLPSLYDVLTRVLGVAPSTDQHEYMAWWLGMWVTDGCSDRPSISQGGADPPDPHHHHEIFARLLLDYPRLFNEPVQKRFDKISSAGWSAFFFDYGVGSVADRVLREYGLINNKLIPRALICDSLDVRQRLLAGIVDGDGHYTAGNTYEISAKDHNVIVGYKEVAATLGLRNSVIAPRTCTNQQTGEEYEGHRMCISGHMWDVVQYCAATYKRCPQPGTTLYVKKNKDPSCYGFSITDRPAGEYFGFAVQGGVNRRFLLEDYTVTHNVSLSVSPPSLPVRCCARSD